MSDHLPDFTGRALLVYQAERDPDGGIAVRFRDWCVIGGETFLEGTEIEIIGKPNSLAGTPVRIAWPSVSRFYEFNTVEELQSTLALRAPAGD